MPLSFFRGGALALAGISLCGSAVVAHGQLAAGAGAGSLPAGVPLRVQLDRTYALKPGTRVEGHLIAPVYRVDHVVLPADTKVSGVVMSTHSVARGERTSALLNGDFTPLSVAVLTFNAVQMPDGSTMPISTEVRERTASVIRMEPAGKRSFASRIREQVKLERQEAASTLSPSGRGDRIRRFVYSQLPLHPQRIWAGTQYDADLTAPLTMPGESTPSAASTRAVAAGPLTGSVEARLTRTLTSANAHSGNAVEAVLTRPLVDATGEILLPEGAVLTGSVLQAKPAGWFGRNGSLRFSFQRIKAEDATSWSATGQPAARPIRGQLTAAESTADQHLTIDAEGGAKATGGPNKLLAPLALGVLAASSVEQDRDGDPLKNGVVSGGFGLAARVYSFAAKDHDVAMGFAWFALSKSIYRRWIAKGHETVFPRDTLIEVELTGR